MFLKNIGWVLMSVFLAFAIAVPVQADSPSAEIKATTDKILAIVTDQALKDPARAAERKRLIREAVNERFDWEEMARRSLARHWSKRTAEEKQEFTAVFSKLLERTYMDKVEGYSGQKVIYEDEVIDGDYGLVRVKIVTSKEMEIPVKYRLKKRGSAWLVYDLSIEGISMVRNYRVQFNNIIRRSSYQNLMKRLTEKMAGE
ncbi:phospholipid-binding protein MlaC [Thermodesulfobacteriota bacterium]